MEKIKIVIVDDHPLMRDALRIAVDTEFDMEVVGEANNGADAIALCARLEPDVVVMDILMPVMDGIEACRQLTNGPAKRKVLMITSSTQDDKVSAALRAGAAGFLMKDAARDQVIHAIREIAQGNNYFLPEITAKLVKAISEERMEKNLTEREQQIFQLLGKGYTNREIAKELFISDTTVRVHIFNMMDKLKLGNRREVIQRAVGHQDNL